MAARFSRAREIIVKRPPEHANKLIGGLKHHGFTNCASEDAEDSFCAGKLLFFCSQSFLLARTLETHTAMTKPSLKNKFATTRERAF